MRGCCGYGSTPASLPRIGGTGQGSVRNVWARRYLVLVLDIVVVFIFFVIEQFVEVILVFVTVDAQGGDLVVGFEEGIFVGFEGVGDFYVRLIDGGRARRFGLRRRSGAPPARQGGG